VHASCTCSLQPPWAVSHGPWAHGNDVYYLPVSPLTNAVAAANSTATWCDFGTSRGCRYIIVIVSGSFGSRIYYISDPNSIISNSRNPKNWLIQFPGIRESRASKKREPRNECHRPTINSKDIYFQSNWLTYFS